jgi:hypothetical protein
MHGGPQAPPASQDARRRVGLLRQLAEPSLLLLVEADRPGAGSPGQCGEVGSPAVIALYGQPRC